LIYFVTPRRVVTLPVIKRGTDRFRFNAFEIFALGWGKKDERTRDGVEGVDQQAALAAGQRDRGEAV